jgi:hypothetical protein
MTQSIYMRDEIVVENVKDIGCARTVELVTEQLRKQQTAEAAEERAVRLQNVLTESSAGESVAVGAS